MPLPSQMLPFQQSEKINIINHETFEKLQQEKDNTQYCQKRIRNAKYKKTHSAKFDLFDFLKEKQSNKQNKTKCRIRVTCTLINQRTKKRGKTREGGRRKHLTKLKKSILNYRKQKRIDNRKLSATIEHFSSLSLINENKTTNCKDLVEGADAAVQPLPIAPTVSTNRWVQHSRRFRPYCDNLTTPLLGKLTEQLLRELDRFQKRAFAQNEIKARAHRRFVVGFREVQNFLIINKVKLVIIAPDCEECKGEDGLDQTIRNLMASCHDQQIPYAFSLRRRQLAYVLFKKVPISCVGVLSYDGARDVYQQLIDALQEAKRSYTDAVLQQ